MPELPEVETIVADLRPHLVGRTIVHCELRFPSIVRHPEPETFIDSITGMRIEAVGRRGKFIFIALGEGRLLVVHLGMTGQLRLVDAATEIANHTHAIFDLDDGLQLRYRDPWGDMGSQQEELLVYGRAGEPCTTCGRPLSIVRIAGRSTVFCRRCQH